MLKQIRLKALESYYVGTEVIYIYLENRPLGSRKVKVIWESSETFNRTILM